MHLVQNIIEFDINFITCSNTLALFIFGLITSCQSQGAFTIFLNI